MSPLPDGYRHVDVAEERTEEFLFVDHLAFASSPSPETQALLPFPMDHARTRAVEDADGRLVAVHGSYEFTLPVPGGEVPCAGLTWVGVRPDQRRRGLLRATIESHFERSLARGEPVSALFAAEPAIYGRFGYGLAADHVHLKLGRGTALRPVAGSDALTVRFDSFDHDQHAELVHRVHVAAGDGRPGWVTRSTDALRRAVLVDPPAWRDGAEAMRIATVHDASGEARAYALLRRKQVWADPGPRYPVTVLASAALDAAASHRLWSLLLDLDLTSEVASPMLPVDDPLLTLLVDVRAVTPRLMDNLWVRLLDLPVALAARRLSAPVDVVLDVTDALLPANAGRWRVRSGEQVAPGRWATLVERTEDDADLRLDVRELGAAYLGGRSVAALARAGLVEELTPGSAHAAAVAFSWPVAPMCSWVF